MTEPMVDVRGDDEVDPDEIPDVEVDPDDEPVSPPDVEPLPDGVEEDPDLLVRA